jgi:hypothetical protein
MDKDTAELIALVRQLRTLGKQYAQKRDAHTMHKIQLVENQIDVRLEKIPVPEPETKTKAPPVTQGGLF